MNRTVLALVAVQLVDAIGLGLLLPVLPYFVQTLGASAVEVTQLVALYALMGMLFSPSVGRLSDRIGRKPLVLFATAATAGTYLLYPVAESLAAVMIVRAASGVLGAKGGVTNAWMIDAVAEPERARYLGLLGSMNGIGMLLGPLLAAGLLSLWPEDYDAVFIGGAVLSMLASAVVLFAPASQAKQPNEPSTATAPLHPDLLTLNFAIFLAFSVVFSASAIYMQHRFHWSVQTAGLAIGAMTATVAVARAVLAHPLLKRWGEVSGTLGCALIMAVSLTAAGSSPSAALFMVFYCLSAGAYAVAAIGVTVLLAKRVPSAARGQAMGRLSASSAAAIVLGAATHGYLFELASPAMPFQLWGTLVSVLVAAGWLYHIRMKGMTHEQA